MTDLQLLDQYVDEYKGFIDPFLFNDLRRRGLSYCVEYLPTDKGQAKAVVRGRLAKTGRYVGDPEIEQFADWVARLETLRAELQATNMADCHRIMPIMDEMTSITNRIAEYYR